LGGRGSRLSVVQMEEVASLLRERFPDINIEIMGIKTLGDIDKKTPLYRIRGRGVFEKEVNRALLDGIIDIAVHSAKDVPFESIEVDNIFPVIPPRRSRFDVLVSNDGYDFWTLPPKSVVGSSSLRRISLIKYYRRDLVVRNIRGNIDTRIGKLERGDYDAIILAEAGIERLRLGINYYRLPMDKFVPAAGQGALLLLVRDEDRLVEICKEINDPISFAEVMVEKIFIKMVGGGCRVPIGITSIFNPDDESIRILCRVVDASYNNVILLDKIYRLPVENATDLERLLSISREFYNEFLSSGAKDMVAGW
jgi:hydroxymethylbilane synthase